MTNILDKEPLTAKDSQEEIAPRKTSTTPVKKYKKDIIQQILDFNFRKKKPDPMPTLLPTLPNLYGLDVRFRAVEK